jgi:ABC-2 type transport system ATP-binding protein
MSIKVTSLSKNYGTQNVLNDISFEAKNGQIIGFLGPNGAGKSTMMKILTGYLKPDEGEVFIDEIDVLKNPLEAQKIIGYLPEHNALYTDMYVREYLNFCSSIHKMEKLENITVKEQIENCIGKVGLTTEAHKKIHQLSKGYQQRVGIAAAILHNPSILILDEPTTGLDPNQLVDIRTLIKELGKEKTVLFSTHIMQEVEAVCDRVLIINKGTLLLNESIKNLKGKSLESVFREITNS